MQKLRQQVEYLVRQGYSVEQALLQLLHMEGRRAPTG